MKTVRKMLSVLLAALLCFGCVLPTSAAESAEQARLYGVYADGMLFQQNAPAVFAGEAVGGSEVQCVLLDASGQTVAKAQGPVNKSNRFSVAFPSPKGGYAEYTVVLSLDGEVFRTLRNVVFGELWLASGQSNVDYPLGQSETGAAMMADGAHGSYWLRFFYVPTFVKYHGDESLFPLDPQRDLEGGMWLSGDHPAVYGVSAVAFFFAQKLQKELDMPVGVLQSSLGGSSIYSWLSRRSIDEDAGVRQDLESRGAYFPEETWQESGHNVALDMTANYNKKMAPLHPFRPVGMIWYQGETELFNRVTPEAYARAFDCLQRCFGRLFDYADGERLPAVYTHLASYHYGDNVLQQMNDAFSRMQAQQPQTRAVTPIYDVPLTFITEIGDIHPAVKQPVGERMAYAAQGLLYGRHTDTYTAAYPTRVECRDGGVYVTLAHTGSGLASRGTILRGFSVCGADGVYVPADAQIVSPDTVRIFADTVPSPAGAGYAMSESNGRADLYATDEDGLAMPVSPFLTDAALCTQLWKGRDWTDCDEAQTWRLVNETNTGFHDTWQATRAAIAYTDDAVSGSALAVTGEARRFSVQPTMHFIRHNKVSRMPDGDYDYSRYSRISFCVRNTGKTPVRLDAVRFYTSGAVWFAPAVEGTGRTDYVIPADGAWHTVTLDLDTVFLFGCGLAFTFSRKKLDSIWDLRLQFSGEEASSQIALDAFRFTPDASAGSGVRLIPRPEALRAVWDRLYEAETQIRSFLSEWGRIIP